MSTRTLEHIQGRIARENGRAPSSNPFPPPTAFNVELLLGHHKHVDWMLGWQERDAELEALSNELSRNALGGESDVPTD